MSELDVMGDAIAQNRRTTLDRTLLLLEEARTCIINDSLDEDLPDNVMVLQAFHAIDLAGRLIRADYDDTFNCLMGK